MADDDKRTDLTVQVLGSPVEITGKVMDNGEVRRRVRMGDVAVHVTTTKVGGWQEAHFHKGLRETYTVIKGRMALATEDPQDDGSRRDIVIFPPGDSVTTNVEEAHNVYLYPGTTIVTVVYDEPVGNPTKTGNDWWPASEGFSAWTKGLSEPGLEGIAYGIGVFE